VYVYGKINTRVAVVTTGLIRDQTLLTVEGSMRSSVAHQLHRRRDDGRVNLMESFPLCSSGAALRPSGSAFPSTTDKKHAELCKGIEVKVRDDKGKGPVRISPRVGL